VQSETQKNCPYLQVPRQCTFVLPADEGLGSEKGCFNVLKDKLEGVWGSGCVDPCFLDLGTSCRCVGSFTTRPINPQDKRPRYPLDRRLCGAHSRSGPCNILTPHSSLLW
jgi:hypothetical protein